MTWRQTSAGCRPRTECARREAEEREGPAGERGRQLTGAEGPRPERRGSGRASTGCGSTGRKPSRNPALTPLKVLGAAVAPPEEGRRAGREVPTALFTSASISAIFAKVPLMVAKAGGPASPRRPARSPQARTAPRPPLQCASTRLAKFSRRIFSREAVTPRGGSRGRGTAFSADSAPLRPTVRCHRARGAADQRGRSGRPPGARRGSRAARPHPAGPAPARPAPNEGRRLDTRPAPQVRADTSGPGDLGSLGCRESALQPLSEGNKIKMFGGSFVY